MINKLADLIKCPLCCGQMNLDIKSIDPSMNMFEYTSNCKICKGQKIGRVSAKNLASVFSKHVDKNRWEQLSPFCDKDMILLYDNKLNKVWDEQSKKFIPQPELSVSCDGFLCFKQEPVRLAYISTPTGEFDCYKNQIYTGDIVEMKDIYSKDNDIAKYVVGYCRADGPESPKILYPFINISEGYYPYKIVGTMVSPCECKIIGNVFENPELMVHTLRSITAVEDVQICGNAKISGNAI